MPERGRAEPVGATVTERVIAELIARSLTDRRGRVADRRRTRRRAHPRPRCIRHRARGSGGLRDRAEALAARRGRRTCSLRTGRCTRRSPSQLARGRARAARRRRAAGRRRAVDDGSRRARSAGRTTPSEPSSSGSSIGDRTRVVELALSGDARRDPRGRRSRRAIEELAAELGITACDRREYPLFRVCYN